MKKKWLLKALLPGLAVLLCLTLAPGVGNADYTMSVGNATVVWTASNGSVNWAVGAPTSIYMPIEQFYYQLNGGTVTALPAFSSPSVTAGSGIETLTATTTIAEGLTLTESFTLTAPSINNSDLSETIAVSNTTGSTLNIFEYAHFNLSGNGTDTGWFSGTPPNTAWQYAMSTSPLHVSETSASGPTISGYEYGPYGNPGVLGDVLSGSLADILPSPGNPATLLNGSLVGDLAWAFEWSLGSESLAISKDKYLYVPLPPSALLLGSGLLGLVGLRWRSRRKS